MPCFKIFSIVTILSLILSAKKNSNKFRVLKGRSAQAEYVEFEVGEEVEVYIQNEHKRLKGKIIRGRHKYIVHVYVPGRGEI